jgi:hypothetical protein
MKPARRARWLALALVLAVAVPVLAITTVGVKVVCPVCGTENDFLDYLSWGSYVYQYPSKFQLVFWPHTWSASVYSCKKCHLSLFMWDFKEFPKDKIQTAKEVLEGVKPSGDYKTYTDIPVSEKLQIAERVYQGLGRGDDFWAHFYRVLGYHFAQEKKPEQARESRQHALLIVQRLLSDPANEFRRKELLITAASMHHFLGDDPAALEQLHTAEKLTYRPFQPSAKNTDKTAGADKKENQEEKNGAAKDDESAKSEKDKEKEEEESAKNYDAYMSALIKEFIPAIEQNKVPDGFEH